MITGTVTTLVTVYYDDGRQAMQARAGDRVEATTINSAGKWIVSKLIRNGRSMLPPGYYFVDGSAIRPDTPPPPPVDPPTGNPILGRVWLNYEKTEKDHNPNNPIPDTRSYIVDGGPINNGRVNWTRRHQYFFLNEMRSYVPDWNQTKEKEWLFRRDFLYSLDDELAMFNGAGSETRRIYPYGLNLDQRLEPWQNFVLFGGQVLELRSRTAVQLKPTDPRKFFPFYGINAMGDFEKYTSRLYPRRWGRLSISYGIDNERSEPSSCFHGFLRYPMFLNNTDIGWIEERFVKVLEDGEVPAPQFTVTWGG